MSRRHMSQASFVNRSDQIKGIGIGQLAPPMRGYLTLFDIQPKHNLLRAKLSQNIKHLAGPVDGHRANNNPVNTHIEC